MKLLIIAYVYDVWFIFIVDLQIILAKKKINRAVADIAKRSITRQLTI